MSVHEGFKYQCNQCYYKDSQQGHLKSHKMLVHELKSVLGFSKGKIHFFPKVLKNWSSYQKNDYHFLGGRGFQSHK